jgi:diguanylate cyclase (GGDEF)-like protein
MSVKNWPPHLFIILGFGMGLGIIWLDAQIPPEFSLTIFYVLPISWITWYVNKKMGLLLAFFCSASQFFVNFNVEYSLIKVNTHSYYLLVNTWNSIIRLLFFLFIINLLAAFKESLEREKRLARTDFLTGIANSRSFFERVELLVQQAKRSQVSITLAYIDIDDFKKINDQFGHLTGDILLKEVAETIQNNIRVIDIVARLGGDEFAIFLSKTTFESAQTILNRIQNELTLAMQDKKWPVSFSMGAVTFKYPPDSIEKMIEKADNLMYFVKQHGKNSLKHEYLTELLLSR